ncbi:hypothetical protein PCANC_11642 [Puccinia coronata f. sp. avenae]|uniref:Uncharacterized protein n=1 Tax=Puccinia coronata f. sp. avenae TaxID=200324 RepID=A0A2N5SVG8_9BASI|nr:hypothetical protein PCANC_11642 [Puccinia coronata f. sp. avenae]
MDPVELQQQLAALMNEAAKDTLPQQATTAAAAPRGPKIAVPNKFDRNASGYLAPAGGYPSHSLRTRQAVPGISFWWKNDPVHGYPKSISTAGVKLRCYAEHSTPNTA